MSVGTLNTNTPNSVRPNKKNQLIRTATDSFTSTSVVNRLLLLGRRSTDSLSFSDTPSKSQIFLRAFSDTLSISDIITKAVKLNPAITDSVSQSDNLAPGGAGQARSITDSFTFSDALTRAVLISRSIADTTVFGEIPDPETSFTRNITDTFTFSDQLDRALKVIGLAADNESLSDAITTLRSFVRTAFDSNLVTDIVQSTHPIGTVVDSFTFSDSIAINVSLGRRATDNLPVIVENLRRIINVAVQLTENLPTSDSINKTITTDKDIIDNLYFSDTTRKLPLSVHGDGSVSYVE